MRAATPPPPDPSVGPTHNDFSTAQLDPLVVLPSDLAQGVAWCERLLGVTPQAGGKPRPMGMHNRLPNLRSAAFPNAYAEPVAIDPEATNAVSAGTFRRFDMDSEALEAAVAAHGPRLIHFDARVPQIDPARVALAALGIDRSAVRNASRATPAGLLEWRIARGAGRRRAAVRPCVADVDRMGAAHPAAAMAASGVARTHCAVRHPQAPTLARAYQAIGLADSVPIEAGAAQLIATLDTPRGRVRLCG